MDEMLTNRALLQVIESGSFSAASEKLDLSVATVARQVTSLEDRLGVKLLNRSTRALSLTEAGMFYAERIREVMHQFDLVKRDVSSYQKDVKGQLRVHLRHSIGTQVIIPALPEFLKAHPDLRMDIKLTDERADLVAEGIDVAVWLGSLEESSLIARKLSPGRRIICCSPKYIAAHGKPEKPEDLRDHNCIVYRARSYDSAWRFKSGDRLVTVPVTGNLESESSAVLLISAINGLGLAMLQESMVRKSIQSGDLVDVLPDYEVSSTDNDVALYAVYSGRKKTSPKTRAFVDFLVRQLRDY